MKCYLLLRNNQETGPYSLEELKNLALKPTDLIWIEGQSFSWKHPAELDALQGFLIEEMAPIKLEKRPLLQATKSVFVAFPPQSSTQVVLNYRKDQAESIETKTQFTLPLDDLQKISIYPEKKKDISSTKTFSKPHTALMIGSVFGGLLLPAGLIKKIIENYDANSIKVATAARPIHEINKPKSETDAVLYQNALTTEVVPVDTVTMKPVVKKVKKINLKKLVFLDANDYQVGLLGGIKNLRLLVINKSAFILDKIKIELQYLKPNGDVIKTENLVMKGVAPKSSKSLSVSSKNRGVKVAYRITDITSKQNSDYLVNL